jgi:hypothetical protein
MRAEPLVAEARLGIATPSTPNSLSVPHFVPARPDRGSSAAKASAMTTDLRESNRAAA